MQRHGDANLNLLGFLIAEIWEISASKNKPVTFMSPPTPKMQDMAKEDPAAEILQWKLTTVLSGPDKENQCL